MSDETIDSLTIEEQAEKALTEAVEEVIDENARLGLPIYVWRDGKLVDIGPEEAAKRGFPSKNGSPK
jgi:hypothetical protein